MRFVLNSSLKDILGYKHQSHRNETGLQTPVSSGTNRLRTLRSEHFCSVCVVKRYQRTVLFTKVPRRLIRKQCRPGSDSSNRVGVLDMKFQIGSHPDFPLKTVSSNTTSSRNCTIRSGTGEKFRCNRRDTSLKWPRIVL